ncbi:hypothetical protein HN51_058401 [Arachis hypogaea]
MDSTFMNLFGSDNGIVKFNGLNYDWFEQIQFQLDYSQSNITNKSIVSNLMTELTTKKFE